MKLHNTPNRQARIEMLPLIDIVFLLLIFFIYAMLSMAVHRGLQLDLPDSSQIDTTKESPISISIRQKEGDTEVFINEKKVDITDLHNEIKMNNGGASNIQALVFAEKRISYQQLFRVLDELHMAGIESISLQANSVEKP